MIQYFAEKDGKLPNMARAMNLIWRERFGRHYGHVQRDAEQGH